MTQKKIKSSYADVLNKATHFLLLLLLLLTLTTVRIVVFLEPQRQVTVTAHGSQRVVSIIYNHKKENYETFLIEITRRN